MVYFEFNLYEFDFYILLYNSIQYLLMESKKPQKHVSAEELLSRFRSKEDLYRYMIHQGNNYNMLS